MNFLDSSIEGSANVPGSTAGEFDGNFVHNNAVIGSFLTKGSRFARCSSAGTVGQGGLIIKPRKWSGSLSRHSQQSQSICCAAAGGALVPTMIFEDAEWLANSAPTGPAIFVQFVSDSCFSRVRVRRRANQKASPLNRARWTFRSEAVSFAAT